MARIVLQGMRFHAFHGVHAEETRFGAPFVVDVELRLELPEVDELARTVDYGRIYGRVAAIVTGERHRLIESLAHRLARDLLAHEPRVAGVTVRVHKPQAPLPGTFDDVFVEVEHER